MYVCMYAYFNLFFFLHTITSHPSTNGQAERFIRTFKRSVKAGQDSGLSVKHFY